jgi:ParB/RepB/Spo0J family partition protein
MVKSVSITTVKANPYQSRKEIGKEGLKLLADEIKAVGFWGGSLRVRERNAHYELVAGHRRLEALRINGRSKIDVEIVDLTDQQMAEQALVENLQREGLPEIDKAEAIARLIEISSAEEKRSVVIDRIRQLLGYRNTGTIHDYLQMADLKPETKQAVRQANTGRHTARVARILGGDDVELANRMVRRVAQVPKPAAEKGKQGQLLNSDDLEAMADAVKPLPERQRKAVVERIATGKLHTPADVKRAANVELGKIKPKDPPPDLMLFIAKYTQDFRAWTNRLKEIKRHKAYIHEHPETTLRFREAAEAFISELKDLLNL